MVLAEHLTLPVFPPLPTPKEATPWAILSWGSALLHGFPDFSASGLSASGTSPGVPCPFNAQGGGNPRPATVARFGFRRQLPCCRLRCRSQVFSTSQRLLLPSAVLPFSGRWRSWGSALQGFQFLPRSPDGSSPPACPPDVAPAGCASPVPRRGNQQARQPIPRICGSPSFTVFRAFVREGIGPASSSHG